jgi:nitroimidazol reductase NimA-like FMN-containing flavoprotein (pyridoxamine 5'-phosphate oxidase superfamily)
MTPDPPRHAEVRRNRERARYDRATIDAVLDEALFCHLGFTDGGRPVVVPTIHVRVGDRLIFHGSAAGRMMRVLCGGADVSAAATVLDGLVLARSVFHHSMNYRSVVVFGRGRALEDPEEKLDAMRAFTDKLIPGRWEDARHPSEEEIRATLMAEVPIDAASAKVRSGPPTDAADDLSSPVWAGVIPYSLRAGDPIPDPRLAPGVELPDYLQGLSG